MKRCGRRGAAVDGRLIQVKYRHAALPQRIKGRTQGSELLLPCVPSPTTLFLALPPCPESCGRGVDQERYEAPGKGLGPFWLGCIAGSIPWIAITIYLVGPGADQHPPGFVYGIFFSLFALFNCFAINQWLQYKQVGKWKDYLIGERAYITLSLVAKSLLAWQIFASTLSASAGQ